MCVMFLHYISDERPKLPGIKLLHSPIFQFSKFALLNSVDSLTFQF